MKQQSFSSLTVLSWLLVLTLALSACAAVDTTDPALELDATPTLLPEMEGDAESAITDTTVTTETVTTDTATLTDTTALTDTAAVTEGMDSATQMGMRDATGVFMRASELDGYPVENLNGEDLGEIDNLIINLSSGEILFANLSYGGFLDLGDKIFPIPLNAFRWDPTFETMLLDVAEETLENAPGVEANWPDLTTTDWDVTANTFWQELDVSTRPMLDEAMTDAAIIRSNELLGFNVQNLAGEDVGDIQDAIVNLSQGTIPYAVMGFGGFLGLGEDLFAVPLRELNATVITGDLYAVAANVDLTEEQLQAAPRLTGDWPAATDATWDADLRDFWGLGDATIVPAADTAVSAEATAGEAADAGIEGIVTTALGPDAASVRLSSILGQMIYDFDDNELGQIEDAVVAIGSGDIVYLIMSGNNEDGRIPLPVGALARTTAENQLVLDADPEIIAGAPRLPAATTGIDANVDEADAEVDGTTTAGVGYFDAILEQEVFDYWAATGAPVVGIYPTTLGATTNRVSGLPPLALEASNMVGQTIVNREQEAVGTLEDAIYEANALRYAILSLNSRDGGEDGRTVIPLYGLIYDIQNQNFILDVTVDELTAAPGFTETDELDLQNVDWSTGINDYWDTQVGLIGQLGVRVLASTTLLAENIIGSDVLGAEQADLGDIEDMIIDPTSGNIHYAVLSFGGFLGIGEDYFAIPLDQLIIDPYGGGFSTSITEEQLEGAPSFGATAWPDFTTPDWDADFRNFWRNEGAIATEDEITGVVRLSELLDNRVVGATGEDLGSVEDILIDFFESQATYYVLNIGGFLDIGEREIAVPWAQPSVFATGEPIQLDVTEEQVDGAPEFDKDVWPTVANMQWLVDADTYWAE